MLLTDSAHLACRPLLLLLTVFIGSVLLLFVLLLHLLLLVSLLYLLLYFSFSLIFGTNTLRAYQVLDFTVLPSISLRYVLSC